MVAPQDEEILRILDLVGKQQTYSLERLLSPIDVIAEEQIVGLWGEATVFKQSEQVIILAVNITTDLNKRQAVQRQNRKSTNLDRSL
jgi:hypothetical protein